MSIQSLMTRNVVTVSMDDSAEHVRQIFEKRSFHHVVVEENGQIVGVISDRDLLKNLSPFIGRMDEQPRDSRLLQRHAHQIMTRDLVFVGPDTSVLDAALVMLGEKVSCLPVVDGRMRCVGIVTTRDLLIWSLRSMEREEEQEKADDENQAA